MIEVLRPNAPLPESAERLRLFGQFVGGWDVEVVNYDAHATTRTIEAEWHFGWVLEGRAVQDVWIAPRRSLRSPAAKGALGDYGAAIRRRASSLRRLFAR